MSKNITYLFKSFVILIFVALQLSCTSDTLEDRYPETIKVSLRNVGHHLLLENKDSTSLVKPIVSLHELKYQLSFESELVIQPERLVALIKTNFEKANLPQHYIVEVVQCEDNEVAYSYYSRHDTTEKGIIPYTIEESIIPCEGRSLPKSCYLINVRFTALPSTTTNYSWVLYLLVFVSLFMLSLFIYKRKTSSSSKTSQDSDFKSIGKFKFYPEQNKLIRQSTEIGLSKKECELLVLLAAEPNQVIKRDILTKKVWEDNGVIVGRSLDTYISRLRKKLQEDTSLKITNVHGIGYKLEVL